MQRGRGVNIYLLEENISKLEGYSELTGLSRSAVINGVLASLADPAAMETVVIERDVEQDKAKEPTEQQEVPV